jgi:hypothetical protein
MLPKQLHTHKCWCYSAVTRRSMPQTDLVALSPRSALCARIASKISSSKRVKMKMPFYHSSTLTDRPWSFIEVVLHSFLSLLLLALSQMRLRFLLTFVVGLVSVLVVSRLFGLLLVFLDRHGIYRGERYTTL